MKLKTALKIILVFLTVFSLACPTYMFVPNSFSTTAGTKIIQDAYAASSIENVKPSVEPVRVARLWIGKKYFVRNADKIATDIAPYVDENGRTLVPLRFVAYALGLDEENVIWNEQDQTVTINANITFPKFYTEPQKTLKRTLVFKIGSPEFTVDGQTKTMDTVPVLVNGRTMLPARFVAENLDYEVLWNDKRLDVTFVPKIEAKIIEYIDYRYLVARMYPILDSDPKFTPDFYPYAKDYSTFPDDVKVLNSILTVPVYFPVDPKSNERPYIIPEDCGTTAYNNLEVWYGVVSEPQFYDYGRWYDIMLFHDKSQRGVPYDPTFPQITVDNFDYYIKPLIAIFFPDNYEEITKNIKNAYINSIGQGYKKVYSFGELGEHHDKFPYLLVTYVGGTQGDMLIELKIQNY